MEPDLDKEDDLEPQPKELTGEHLLTTEYLGVCPIICLLLWQFAKCIVRMWHFRHENVCL